MNHLNPYSVAMTQTKTRCQYCSRRKMLLGVLLLLVWLPLSGQVGHAQVAIGEAIQANGVAVLPQTLTTESVDNFVSGLSDETVREVLREELNLNAQRRSNQHSEPSRGIIELTRHVFARVASRIMHAVHTLPHLFDGVVKASRHYVNGRTGGEMLLIALRWVVAIVVALLVERLVRWFTRGWYGKINSLDGRTLWQTVKTLGARFFLEVLGVLTFVVTCRLLAPHLFPLVADRELFAIFIISIVLIARLIAALSRFLFAPSRADLRLMTVDDYWASYLHRGMVNIGVLVGSLSFVISALVNNDVAPGSLLIGFWINAAMYGYVVYLLWRARGAITKMLIGGDQQLSEREIRLMNWWPWISIFMVIANWMLIENIVAQQRFELLRGQERLTLLLIIMAPALGMMIRGLVHHLTPPMVGEGRVAERAFQETKRGFVRIGRVLLFVLLFVLIAAMWGVDLRNVAAAGVGRQMSGRLIEALVLLAAGYIIYETVNLLMNRKLAREQTEAGYDLESDEGGEGGTGISRLASVLPLVQKVLLSAIAVMTALVVLGQLGVDTTPLLAGAGIVGLAIGFGAQTLVRDIVSGLFFLTDDAFRLGEFVDIDGTLGRVEKISIRSMQLRHHLGAIHTIPYGEIPKVTNNSRDWVITKLKFTVPFDTDINRVKKIFKQIGKDMMQVPEYADIMMQPFKSQGVYDVDDVGIVIRGKFMAKPGTQYTLRKDIYMRVQKMFAENNIEFARREVHVRMPGLSDDKGSNTPDSNTSP